MHGACYHVSIHASGRSIEYVFVKTALRIYLIWRAMLHYSAVVKNVNLVAVDDLSDVVAYDNHGAVFLYGINGILDLFRCYCIKACRRLVKKYDRRVLKKHSRYRNALLLTSAQLQRIAFETLWQGNHLVIYIYALRAAAYTSSIVAVGLP